MKVVDSLVTLRLDPKEIYRFTPSPMRIPFRTTSIILHRRSRRLDIIKISGMRRTTLMKNWVTFSKNSMGMLKSSHQTIVT